MYIYMYVYTGILRYTRTTSTKLGNTCTKILNHSIHFNGQPADPRNYFANVINPNHQNMSQL